MIRVVFSYYFHHIHGYQSLFCSIPSRYILYYSLDSHKQGTWTHTVRVYHTICTFSSWPLIKIMYMWDKRLCEKHSLTQGTKVLYHNTHQRHTTETRESFSRCTHGIVYARLFDFPLFIRILALHSTRCTFFLCARDIYIKSH